MTRFAALAALLAAGWACAQNESIKRVQDEGTRLPSRSVINFRGATVSCVDAAASGRTDCYVHQARAFGRVTTNGAGAVSLVDGYNVTSVTLPGGSVVRITFASALDSADYVALVTAQTGTHLATASGATTTTVDVLLRDTSANAVVNPATTSVAFSFAIFGN